MHRFVVAISLLFVAPVGAQDAPAPAADADKADAKPKQPPPPPGKVRITFTTRPEVKADVHWGRKVLCTTPCTILRDEDSGPLDVVFKKSGYLTVNTRAFTFKNDYVAARMNATSQAHKIYGYKAPVEDDEDGE